MRVNFFPIRFHDQRQLDALKKPVNLITIWLSRIIGAAPQSTLSTLWFSYHIIPYQIWNFYIYNLIFSIHFFVLLLFVGRNHIIMSFFTRKINSVVSCANLLITIIFSGSGNFIMVVQSALVKKSTRVIRKSYCPNFLILYQDLLDFDLRTRGQKKAPHRHKTRKYLVL